MLHDDRQWQINEVQGSAADLWAELSRLTWTTCTGFKFGDTLLFLNDSTGPDGAQEYAVCEILEDGTVRQVESYTISWMDEEKFISSLEQTIDSGGFPGRPFHLPEHPNDYCAACA